MTYIPPTTALDIDADDNCPECDARLSLVSPPHGYECDGCGREYHIEGDASDGGDETDSATCETVMSNGEVCGRELPCQYHS